MSFAQLVNRKTISIIIFTFSLTIFSCASNAGKKTLVHKETTLKYDLKDKVYVFANGWTTNRKRSGRNLFKVHIKYKKNIPTHVIFQHVSRLYNSQAKFTLAITNVNTYRVDRTSESELETTIISTDSKVAGEYSGPNAADVEKWDENPSYYTYGGIKRKTDFPKEGSKDLFTVMEDGKILVDGNSTLKLHLLE